MKKKVLIGGGSGLVGTRLTNLLIDEGYEVAHLSRSKDNDLEVEVLPWDVEENKLDASSIEDFPFIINLAGADIIDKKWTSSRKKVIRDSRVKSNLLLKRAIEANQNKPEFFISASAIGYYGMKTVDHIFTEDDLPGNDFLSKTCVEWESSADEIAKTGVKTAKIRIGVVLSDEGGALMEMAKPIKFGVGAPLGDGNQYMPWIHIDDLARILHFVMQKRLEGVYNAVAPEEADNRKLTKKIAEKLNRPLLFPNVPAFVIRLLMGKRSEMILKGSRVSSKKIQNESFEFIHPDLDSAIEDLYI